MIKICIFSENKVVFILNEDNSNEKLVGRKYFSNYFQTYFNFFKKKSIKKKQ